MCGGAVVPGNQGQSEIERMKSKKKKKEIRRFLNGHTQLRVKKSSIKVLKAALVD